MISSADLMQRLGSGGRPVPFFKCVCVYFLIDGWWPGDGASPALAAAKCAPVLCLLLLVALGPSGDKGRLVATGLALSALGDAFLVWPQYFLPGMLAFGAAHACYMCAFGWSPNAPLLGVVLMGSTIWYTWTILTPPTALSIPVKVYGFLLGGTAWRGTARFCSGDDSKGAQLAGAGSLLFLVSDAILGYSMFTEPVPYGQVLVMSTYYVGQLGIALSAVEPPSVAARVR